MFRKHKRYRVAWSNLANVIMYGRIKEIKFKGCVIPPSSVSFMGVVLLEGLRTNDFVKIGRVRELVGSGLIGDGSVRLCVDLGLVDAPFRGCYVLTSDGEYFLRDIETFLDRIATNKPLSKWRKIQSADDPRLKYVRPARVKGSFVSKQPRDSRSIARRVKAGLVPVWVDPKTVYQGDQTGNKLQNTNPK